MSSKTEKDAGLEGFRQFLKKETGKDYKPEEVAAGLKGLEVHLRPYVTIKMHDLVNKFPNTLDPHLVEARTEWKVIEQKKKNAGMDKGTIFMYLMLILGVTLAAVIAYKFLKQGDTSCTCQFPGGLWTAGQTIAQNLTG